MDEIASWFTANPWGILVLAACTILGTVVGIVGIVLFFRGQKEKRPCYSVSSYNVIQRAKTQIPDLEIHYRQHGGNIANLTISRVSFWNNGRATIRKADVPKATAIAIRMTGEAVILNAEKLFAKKDENKFDVTKSVDRKTAAIAFEYIDHLDGAVFQVIHTGTSSDDLTLDGTIMEGGTIKRINPLVLRGRPRSFQTVIVLAVMVPIVSLRLFYGPAPEPWQNVLAFILGFLGTFIFLDVVAAYLAWSKGSMPRWVAQFDGEPSLGQCPRIQ